MKNSVTFANIVPMLSPTIDLTFVAIGGYVCFVIKSNQLIT